MSAIDEMWQTAVYTILPHPAETAVWLHPEAGSWSLPYVCLAEALWTRASGRLNQALQDKLGLPVTILYCADYQSDEEKRQTAVVHVLENHNGAAELPLEGQWVGRERLAGLSLAQPEHRPLIEVYLAEMESGSVPVNRPAWSRPGWFEEAAAWMESELARCGYSQLGPVEQANSWCLSCVLRVPTEEGDIYFKVAADLPLFVNEPAVVAGLAALFPDNIPAPLSMDLGRRWMLLADFGPPVDDGPSLEARIEMLRLFAQIQIAAAAHLPDLTAMGCFDRRLDKLAVQVDALLNDAGALAGLTEAELEQFKSATPRLKAMCAELADFGIPETLVHGDLHLGNAAYENGRMLFFDWTDACIAHPFLDMISIFDEKDEAVQHQLRDAYLALWTDYGSMAQLRQAWALAERLSALHQAVSYQFIMPNLEETPRKAFGNVIPHFVRRAMRGVNRPS